jgi:hypothetical protein
MLQSFSMGVPTVKHPALLPLLAALALAAGCNSKGPPAKNAAEKRLPVEPQAAPVATADTAAAPGWQPVDVSSLDEQWRALLEACLTEKRKDGQNIDNYELVETKQVGPTRYLYFTPKRSPNEPMSSDHFGCKIDSDNNVHVLYEG